MNFKEASELEKQIGCHEAIAVVVGKGTNDKYPSPDIESNLACKEKVKQGIIPNECYVINGTKCPKGRE